MRNSSRALIVLMVVFATSAWGNGLNISGIGSRSAAMGDSYYAVADDYTSVFWCPAALAEVDGPEFNATVLDIIPTATYKYAAININTESIGGQNIFPNASFAQGGLAGGKFGYGFGAYASAGSGAEWDGNDLRPLTGGNYGKWKGSLKVYEFAGGVGYSPHPAVSVGGSFYIDYGLMSTNVPVPLSDTEPVLYGNMSEDLNGLGFSGAVGVKVRPHRAIDLAFTFKPKRTIKLDGTAEILELQQLGMPTSSGLSRDVSLPMELMGGVALKPWHRLLISVGTRYNFWSDAVDRFVSVYDDPAWSAFMSRGGANVKVLNWKNSYMINAGFEFKLNPTIDLRGGTFYDPSPAPDATYDFFIPNCDLTAITGGTGVHFGGFDFDLALEYVKGKERNITVATLNNVPGVHGMTVKVVNFGVTYHL
jgi:long-chain fatty acid transport protein